MRSISISTHLDCDADVAFEALQSIQAFVHVAHGAARFPVAEQHVTPLVEGEAITGWVFLLGVIPFSKHTIGFEIVDPATRTLRSNEHGGLLKRWDHTITTTPEEGGCRYVDEVDIDAGLLTPLVVAYAHAFYRYRQRRWRRLAPVLEGAAQVRLAA